MKLITDERVKHRLIGLAVILSIVAIFTPAIMKKSSQRFDDNLNISVELPPKPTSPKIVMLEKKALFETVKVAQVEIPPVPKIQPMPVLAKAELLHPVDNTVILPAIPLIANPIKLSSQNPVTPVNTQVEVKKKVMTPPPPLESALPRSRYPVAVEAPKNGYVVQLGTFSQLSNAKILVKKLHDKGYKGTYNKVIIRDKIFYKVIVGQGHHKEQAQILQRKLANSIQIMGMVVPTKVS